MVHQLEGLAEPPPLPADIEVREVISDEDIYEFNELAAWRWAVPEVHRPHLQAMIRYFRPGQPGSHTRFWLAWQAGKPISKIGCYYAPGSAGIYAVATIPEARGQGIASALTLVALSAAKEAGKKMAVLHSSPLAEPLYARLGFETVTAFHLLTSEDTII
jgi:GNAT superfamily N-acetyltransferase